MKAKTRAKLIGLANYLRGLLNKLANHVTELLREPSTKRGVVYFLAGLGAVNDPARAEAIIAGGLMIAGAIGIVTRDTK